MGVRQAFFWASLPLIFSCEQHLTGALCWNYDSDFQDRRSYDLLSFSFHLLTNSATIFYGGRACACVAIHSPFFAIRSGLVFAFSLLESPTRVVTKTNPIFAHAIIVIMEVGDIRLYKERWKAVEEIEQQELRAMTPEQHWQKLNAIVRFAIETGMEIENNDGEMEVFLRWAKLKARYEAGQKS